MRHGLLIDAAIREQPFDVTDGSLIVADSTNPRLITKAANSEVMRHVSTHIGYRATAPNTAKAAMRCKIKTLNTRA